MSAKEDRLWSDGYEAACQTAREKGIDGLLAEERARGLMGFNGRLTITDLDYNRYSNRIKLVTFQTLRIAFVSILHDEFGFGRQRIDKFLHLIDKMFVYSAKGWVYWMDYIDRIQTELGKSIPVDINDDIQLINYKRPENKDFYEPTDWIDKKEWEGLLERLDLIDTGRRVTSKDGADSWEYKDEYDIIQVYDNLCGIEYAVKYLGAHKPGEGPDEMEKV